MNAILAKKFVGFAIDLLKIAAPELPGLIDEIVQTFSVGNPTEADYEKLRARVNALEVR